MEPLPVAVVPALAEIERAIADAGGRVAPAEEAAALVWTDPRDPDGLRACLARSPARWVQLPFAGIERFIEAGALDPGRTWTCTKGAYGPACAELAVGGILLAARRLHEHARARTWMRGDARRAQRRVQGSTALVVGTGGIGRALAPMLRALGIRVLAANRSGAAMEDAERTVAVHALAEILPEADWVVIAAALTPDTRHLFDAAMLASMREDAWLINVARGAIVDTDALVTALEAGRIGGAVLDVTDPEPLPDGHPLWALPNVVVTSHTANTWEMAVPELAAMVRRNIARFTTGEPLDGLVDLTLGY